MVGEKHILTTGDIIEQYPDDYPYPSCLVSSVTVSRSYLHVVCGIGDGEIWVISAYHPDPDRWDDGYRKRKDE